MFHLLKFASSYSQNLPVYIAMGIPMDSARNDKELLDLETKHQVFSFYVYVDMWLSPHFKEETVPYVKKAEAMATDIAELLGQSLTNANRKPELRKIVIRGHCHLSNCITMHQSLILSRVSPVEEGDPNPKKTQ